MKTRTRALGAALAACVLIGLAPVAASAAPTISKLRVEAGGRALSPGTSYVNGSARLVTAPSQCEGSGASHTVAGPSAVGIINYAKQTNTRLRPYYISDKFDFGLIVCRIGDRGAFNPNEAWLYKVNHASPSVGGEQYALRRGDQVLWYFADFATGKNTGDELRLATPARVRPGEPFTVKAIAYDYSGTARPAEGATITGGASATTGSDGTATVVASSKGTLTLRTRRGNDVPAAPEKICVNQVLERCPSRRGERIIGRAVADVIVATRGADSVIARGGDDRIDVRGGERDTVSCGGGWDRVQAGWRDRVASDCERLNGRARG